MRRGLIFLVFFIFLEGCMVGPDYIPPCPCIPDSWEFNEEITYAEPVNEWWFLFNDTLLNKYIELAYCNNNEVNVAEANICRARAIVTVTASKLYPQVFADFNASRTYFSKNGPLFAASSFSQGINPVTGLPFQIQIPQIQSLYNALLAFTWDIDLWGKTRRAIESSCYAYQSYIEQKNNTLITILSEVASSYIKIRSYQKIGSLLEQNISLLEQQLEITKRQQAVGIKSRLDLENIEALVLNAKAELPYIFVGIVQNIYALSILTGNLPETFMCELLPMQPLPKFPEAVAVGMRSDLLRRRPDVRYAERLLAQSTANIGVAVASFFPTITLSGDVGFQSLALRNLFESRSKTWSIQGDALMPIFDGCNLIGNLRVAEASAIAAIYNYQETVLNALKEAEGHLIAYIQELKSAKLYEESVQKYQDITYITERRFEVGLSNIVDFIQAELQLIKTEEYWVLSETAALLSLVNLYQALGGGWQTNCCLD